MSKIKTLILPLAIVIALTSSAPVAAFDVLFYSSNGVDKYNPDDAGSCGPQQVTATVATQVGGEHLEGFLRFFTEEAGYSLAAAAGIAGNINAESKFNPAVIQGGAIADSNYDPVNNVDGFGLAQWTSSGRQQALVDFAKSKKVSIIDFTMQMEFIVKEMSASTYADMRSKLSSNKTDPIAAAAVFHGKTPNIEAEANINPTFAASGASYGYERSGDTSDDVIKNRGGFAKAAYNKYQGVIPDGAGASAVVEDEETTIVADDDSSVVDDQECSSPTDETSPLEAGDGDFVDSGEVTGWANVLANSQAADAAYGDSLVGDGICAAIVSRVWRGQNIGYGFPPHGYAIDAWDRSAASIRHPDRNVKLGAILLYRTSSRAGHVTIYLGNNKILNDGQIVDASFVEKGWGSDYVGWIDPNDLGWKSIKAADIKAAVGE